MREAIDALLDAIDDAADGQEAWQEYGPYRLILQRAKELRNVVPGLKESYEPKDPFANHVLIVDEISDKWNARRKP